MMFNYRRCFFRDQITEHIVAFAEVVSGLHAMKTSGNMSVPSNASVHNFK